MVTREMETKEPKNNSDSTNLLEFRKNLQDILKPEHTDQMLLKYLRVKQFDLRKAEKLFRYGYRCRESYQLDSIVKTYKKPEVCEKYEFLGFLGFAKDGTPIRYVAAGWGDYDAFVSSLSTFSLCLYCSFIIEQDLEALRNENKKTGRQIDNITYIFDVEGLTIQQMAHKHVIESGLDLMRMQQEFYPEGVRRVLFINAPGYFSIIFNIFKPILRFGLIERIYVVSKDSSSAELLKYIDADVLPVFLGGDRVDSNGDPKCSEFIKFGGKIPEKYYLKNLPELQANDPGVETTIIAARSVFEHVFNVPIVGSKLKIEFRSDYSIFLKIIYKNFHSDLISSSDSSDCDDDNYMANECISPPAKIQSNIAPVDAEVLCLRAGLYILHFDNTYSWINSKRLVHRFQVIPPT